MKIPLSTTCPNCFRPNGDGKRSVGRPRSKKWRLCHVQILRRLVGVHRPWHQAAQSERDRARRDGETSWRQHAQIDLVQDPALT